MWGFAPDASGVGKRFPFTRIEDLPVTYRRAVFSSWGGGVQAIKREAVALAGQEGRGGLMLNFLRGSQDVFGGEIGFGSVRGGVCFASRNKG